MLALGMYRRLSCARCGHYLPESTDARHEGRYVPLAPLQCHACAGLDTSEKAYQEHPQALTLMHRIRLRRG